MGELAEEIAQAFSVIDAKRNEDQKAKEDQGFVDGVEANYASVVESERSKAKKRFERTVNSNANHIAQTVIQYYEAAYAKMLCVIEEDEGFPLKLDFERYFTVLQAIERSATFLSALKQILVREHDAIERLYSADPTIAYQKGSALLVEDLKKLDSIRVIKPITIAENALSAESKVLIDSLKGSLKDEENRLKEGFDAILDEALGDLAHPDELFQSAIKEVDQRIEAINDGVNAATEKMETLLQQRARLIAGKTLSLEGLQEFKGSISLVGGVDLDILKALAHELDISFDTYSQIIRDQGLFAAFPNGVSCLGYFAISSDFRNREDCLEVPEEIDQEPGGDSLQTAVLRMREFNKAKYQGILDDGYHDHVVAFWYGFAKLAEFLEEASRLDDADVVAYRKYLEETLSSQAKKLGMFMDDEQIEGFDKAVEVLKKKVESYDY